MLISMFTRAQWFMIPPSVPTYGACATAMKVMKKNARRKNIKKRPAENFRKIHALAMKRLNKMKFKQPEPRRYKYVFWNVFAGLWWAQKTNPAGHIPRQTYVGSGQSQKKCAEMMAVALKCTLLDLLLDRRETEGNQPRLYKGVFYHKRKKCWMAQVTHPVGHKPRQEFVGQGFKTQKAAAEALAEHLGQKVSFLRHKKHDFYKGAVAVRRALKNFQVLQKLWVKKKMIPGVWKFDGIICPPGFDGKGNLGTNKIWLGSPV
jgi:hypothetical protein